MCSTPKKISFARKAHGSTLDVVLRSKIEHTSGYPQHKEASCRAWPFSTFKFHMK